MRCQTCGKREAVGAWNGREVCRPCHNAALDAVLARQGASGRFALAGRRVMDSHGGQPTASIGADGQIVFTYPDGVKTCGGVRIA